MYCIYIYFKISLVKLIEQTIEWEECSVWTGYFEFVYKLYCIVYIYFKISLVKLIEQATEWEECSVWTGYFELYIN